MKDEPDTNLSLDWTQVGVWNEERSHKVEIAALTARIDYWQVLACANRKVAEEAQAQRDKLAEALKVIRGCLVDGAVTLTEKKTASEIAIQIDDLLKECGK